MRRFTDRRNGRTYFAEDDIASPGVAVYGSVHRHEVKISIDLWRMFLK